MSFVKHDKGKVQPTLIVAEFITEIAKILTLGVKKYGKNNWKLCKDTTRYKDALERHWIEYKKGVLYDKDGFTHLGAVATNAMFLFWFEFVKTEKFATDTYFDTLPAPTHMYQRSICGKIIERISVAMAHITVYVAMNLGELEAIELNGVEYALHDTSNPRMTGMGGLAYTAYADGDLNPPITEPYKEIKIRLKKKDGTYVQDLVADKV